MKSNKLIMSASLLTVVMAVNSALASNLKSTYQVERPVAQSVPTGLQAEQPRVEYIWPKVQPALSVAPGNQNVSSDYYWQVVTGKELSTGVKVYTTTGNALLRLAPKADTTSGARVVSAPLDMAQLTLKNSQNKSLALRQLASVEAMKLAGFDDGSVALRLPENHSAKPMILKSTQKLSQNAQYLLQVKEKSSAYNLYINAPRTIAQSGNSMSLTLSIAGTPLSEIAGASTQVQLLSNSESNRVLEYADGAVKLPMNLSQVGAFEGLYELQISTLVNLDGNWIKRSAKVPFAQHVNTAEILGGLQRKGESLFLPILVHEPGRYSVTATLQGRDAKGQVVNLQTADVAQWLSKRTNLELPFDLGEFTSLAGTFKLVNVQLKDQSRMMPLQQLFSVEFDKNTW